MTTEVEVQNVSEFKQVPTQLQFESWVNAALQNRTDVEILIRIVDQAESAELNSRYRNKPGPTNVLSFPAEIPAEIELPLLGDIVICAPVLADEASAQGKPEEAHWAHLTIHGVLHLLGYDHQDEIGAHEMETLEKTLVKSLGYPNPYC